MVIVGDDGRLCIACLTSLDENENKVIFFPIGAILRLNEDPNTERVKPVGWEPKKELFGHPILDCPEECIVVECTPQKIKSLKRILDKGVEVPTVRDNSGGTIRIGRHRVEKLGLSQFELDWIETYCMYTFDDKEFLSEKLNLLINGNNNQQTKKVKKNALPKQKIKAKNRRKIDREKQGGIYNG